ncbi:MAG: hypothetical protein KDC98_20535 [Planctomycetes bacterium]|nr:hypothetical protein [Planctomycetota bacterium]
MTAAAQHWQVPAEGAVEYRRECESGGSDVCGSAVAARAAPVTSGAAERYLPGIVPAPWLCHGELTADGREPGGPVRDLRDVLRRVALGFDGRGVNVKFLRVVPYGDLTVSGSWRAEADGCETLTAQVSSRRLQSQRGESRDAVEQLRTFCVVRTEGELRLRRRIDFERGVVASFDGEIDVVVEEGDRQFRRLRAVDAWQLVAVRENQDADFRKRVAAAVAAGAAFVKAALANDRSYLDGRVREDRSYGSGRLALALLTLLHAHVPIGDDVVSRGFAELRRRRFVDSYSLAAALMAMARRSAVPGVELDDRDRAVAGRFCDRLLTNIDPRVERAELLRFNYTAGPRYDTSVQQYGLLGLVAAQRLGVEVDGRDFAAAARQLLAVQCPASGRRALHTVSYRQQRLAAGGEAEGTRRMASCRGFAYVDRDEAPFGSMTAAGISGLLLASAGMEAAGHGDRSLQRRIDEAVHDGFAWLAEHFSVRCNPGFAERGRFHWYYWLYCLERSCELAGLARLGGRDWYYEGALQLMAQQQKGGGFQSGDSGGMQIECTCFAVLFLAKAAGQAAITPR